MAEQEEVEISGPAGTKFRARGSDVLGIIQLVALTLITYGGYLHTVEAKGESQAIVQAIKDSNSLQREQVNAMREANCLSRLTPAEKARQENIEFCRQLGKGR